MKNLFVIGTSHISRQSMDEIERLMAAVKPDIVAVELDAKRLQVLLGKKPRKLRVGDIRRIGFKGFLFAALGSLLQQRLGKMVGVAPGSEMKTAVQSARRQGAEIALIDQDIEVTLRRFSQALSWKERFRFAKDLFVGLILGKGQKVQFDLNKVPSEKVIQQLVSQLKKRYPNIHKVLIEERNSVMAGNIIQLIRKNPQKKILVVVGAGHKGAIEKEIERKVERVR